MAEIEQLRQRLRQAEELSFAQRPADDPDQTDQIDGYMETVDARRRIHDMRARLNGGNTQPETYSDSNAVQPPMAEGESLDAEDPASVQQSMDENKERIKPGDAPDPDAGPSSDPETYERVRDGLPVTDLLSAAEAAEATDMVAFTKSAVDTAGAVIGNVTDVPGSIVSGARDAVKETRDFIENIGNSVEQTVASVVPWLPSGVVWDKKGLRIMGAAEFVAYKEANGIEGLPDVPNVPEWMNPETPLGNITNDISQFITGFVGAGKLRMIKAIKPVTKAGKAGKAAVQGAVADAAVFDELEGNLFDLAGKHPALTPYVQALMTDEDDKWYTNRARQALSGVVPGVMVDALVAAGRGLRQWRSTKNATPKKKAKVEAKTENRAAKEAAEAEKGEALRKEVADLLGHDPEKASRLTRKAAEKLIKGKYSGEAPEFIDINWAHINEPDDVKSLMQDMTIEDAKAIETRRGKKGGKKVVSWDTTDIGAQRENVWQNIVERNIGDSANAKELLSMKRLWVASGNKLTQVMKHYNDAPSQASHAAAAHMIAVHRMVQREFLGAQAEVGRALNILRKDIDGSQYQKHLDVVLDLENSASNVKTIAERISLMARTNNWEAIDKFVYGTAWTKTKNAIKQVWINALLSAPQTHAVNFASNAAYLPLLVSERKLAQMIGDVTGNDAGYVAGETGAMVMGMVDGVKDSLKAMAESWQSRQVSFLDQNASTLMKERSKYEVGKMGAFQAEVLGVDPKSHYGKALNFFDAATQTPGKALGLADELFKSIAYRAEMRAGALRQATMEFRAGKITQDQVKSQYAKYVENPPKNVKLEAVDTALYATFSQAPDQYFAKMVDGVRVMNGMVPALGTFLMPFRNVVINLTTANLERLPILNLMVDSARKDLAKGGRHADMVAAKMAMGSMLLLGAADMRFNNTVIGRPPEHPGEAEHFRRVYGGIQNAVTFDGGETYISFDRLEPVGAILAIGASIADLAMNLDASNEEDTKNLTDVIAAVTLGVGNSLTDKSVMETTMSFWQAISDPKRYGAAFFEKAAGSLVPAGAAAVERFDSPWVREAQSMLDAIKRRIPGLSADLPVTHDLHGRPVHHKSPMGDAYDFVGPAHVRQYDAEPIDQEFERLDYFPQMPPKQLTYKNEFGVSYNVDVSRHPFAYERFKQLAGNEVVLPQYNNMTWLENANQIAQQDPSNYVSQIYWQIQSDAGKAEKLRGMMQEYRAAAVTQLVEEFPELTTPDFMKRKEESTQAGDQVSQQLDEQFR